VQDAAAHPNACKYRPRQFGEHQVAALSLRSQHMIIDIPSNNGDDPHYLTAICSWVASLARLQKPAAIYVTRVKKCSIGRGCDILGKA
jgi:hypothetical protein